MESDLDLAECQTLIEELRSRSDSDLSPGSSDMACIELMSSCGRCGAGRPINEPVESAVCAQCGVDTPVPPWVWKKLLGDLHLHVQTMAEGVTLEGRWELDGDEARWTFGRDAPTCDSCGARTRSGEEFDVVTCPKCSATEPLSQAPAWLGEINPAIRSVALPGGEQPATGARAHSITCNHCGGELTTDGSDKTVECDYCNKTSVLSDEVWAALHPPRSGQRFWLALELEWDSRRVTPDLGSPFVTGCVGAGLTAIPLFLVSVTGVLDWLVVLGLWAAVPTLVFVAGFVYQQRTTGRRTRIARPEHEVLGRIDSATRDGEASHPLFDDMALEITLLDPKDPSREIRSVEGSTRRWRLRRLGGRGATIRAFAIAERPGSLLVYEPSILDRYPPG